MRRNRTRDEITEQIVDAWEKLSASDKLELMEFPDLYWSVSMLYADVVAEKTVDARIRKNTRSFWRR